MTEQQDPRDATTVADADADASDRPAAVASGQASPDATSTDERAWVATDEDAPDPDEDDFDLLPAARGGLGRVTAGLLVGIALVAAFSAGVWAEKRHAPKSSAAGARSGFAALRAGGGGEGFAAGGAGGFGGFGGGAGAAGGTSGSSGSSGTSGGTGSSASTPAVIGTVVKVSGRTVTVRNFGGKLVTVTVPAGTDVTKSSTLALTDLKPGATVTVTGTTATDGKVTADAVTTH